MRTRELIEWLRKNSSGIYRPAAEAANRMERMLDAIESIDSNPEINLSDVVYQVKDSEGKGWDGPNVPDWGNAAEEIENILKES